MNKPTHTKGGDTHFWTYLDEITITAKPVVGLRYGRPLKKVKAIKGATHVLNSAEMDPMNMQEREQFARQAAAVNGMASDYLIPHLLYVAEHLDTLESAEEDTQQSQGGLNTLNALHTSPNTARKLPSWPVLHKAALSGLPGDIVRLIAPHTEADPVALLCQTLCAFGVAVGRSPYFPVEADKHHMNTFLCLVGQTAKGRKGTSAGYMRRLFTSDLTPDTVGTAAPESLEIVEGLSSGEGLIWQVRDPITKREPVKDKGRVIDYQEVMVDAGIDDKRLLVLESEFARVLAVMERETNTLSATLREAWDTGNLRVMTKNTPARATEAHVGIIGHITAEELRRCLTETSAANGFGNRFLWVCVKRSKLLPDGGKMSQVNFFEIKKRVNAALRFARTTHAMARDDAAKALWHDAYALLTADRPGLLGSITGRAEAQVLRLSCVYALMDQSAVVKRHHLEAAIALWDYAAQSAVYLFGDSLGDPLADEILRMLRLSDGMSRTDLYNAFGRNRKSGEIGAALERLLSRHLVRMDSIKTADAKRPTEMWHATNETLYRDTHLTHLTQLINRDAATAVDTTECEQDRANAIHAPVYAFNPDVRLNAYSPLLNASADEDTERIDNTETYHAEERMKPPRSKLRGITRKGIVCETPRFLTLFPLQGNLGASSEESPD